MWLRLAGSVAVERHDLLEGRAVRPASSTSLLLCLVTIGACLLTRSRGDRRTWLNNEHCATAAQSSTVRIRGDLFERSSHNRIRVRLRARNIDRRFRLACGRHTATAHDADDGDAADPGRADSA